MLFICVEIKRNSQFLQKLRIPKARFSDELMPNVINSSAEPGLVVLNLAKIHYHFTKSGRFLCVRSCRCCIRHSAIFL